MIRGNTERSREVLTNSRTNERGFITHLTHTFDLNKGSWLGCLGKGHGNVGLEHRHHLLRRLAENLGNGSREGEEHYTRIGGGSNRGLDLDHWHEHRQERCPLGYRRHGTIRLTHMDLTVEIGLSQAEIRDLAQKAAQLILSGRDGDSEALQTYKQSAEFRAGVQLACAAMVLVVAENNSRIAEQLAAKLG